MADLINFLIPVGLAAVAIVLLLGIWNMFRHGPANRSQLLMRWRVGLQFLVIVLVMGGLYFFGTGR
ncbi:hypothetical protein FIV06_06375 [Labrenzia sp. THAF191b]|jgi:hypothetical protein|uniref:twin transmembrane helix small protein n=1 Tax=unclassified Labrenzia TaxID=2648686 RepID=UPI0012682EC1|nr:MULTISPECIES: twin transmembrane helix small protein [unclassified Labrenzia]QFS97036.1 hypothetical protein FIV06_06375 [Labrenzia sp. THAF191b]QFT03351.1 hypothetical protein FIV05_06375 [Labrenzia sp. THAF191a]QFT14893.1 hypothetical protein FIV03_06380 [Labrenzia sp. THAF187b]